MIRPMDDNHLLNDLPKFTGGWQGPKLTLDRTTCTHYGTDTCDQSCRVDKSMPHGFSLCNRIGMAVVKIPIHAHNSPRPNLKRNGWYLDRPTQEAIATHSCVFKVLADPVRSLLPIIYRNLELTCDCGNTISMIDIAINREQWDMTYDFDSGVTSATVRVVPI